MRGASPFSFLRQIPSEILDGVRNSTPNRYKRRRFFEFGMIDCSSFFRCHVNDIDRPLHPNALRTIAIGMAWLLFAKAFLSILYQYRFYFPADFESDFLIVRRDWFHGVYRFAFYAHIVSSPVALLAGLFLVVSGPTGRYRHLHRLAGRFLAVLVFAFVTPSGLVMAAYAPAGMFAGAGLASLAIGTGGCLFMAIRGARDGRIAMHRRWAMRCFILLCSPLLLRLITGFVIVLRLDPAWNERVNPWLSWLFPLVSFEFWWRFAVIPEPARPPVSILEATPCSIAPKK